METKFLHEHRKRQDKARKGDYREEFYAESAFKDSQPHLESFKRMLEIGKLRMKNEAERRNLPLACKQKLALRYCHGVYRLGEHDYQLRWSFKEFIRHNGIEINRSQTHKKHMLAAKRDCEAIIGAIFDSSGPWRLVRNQMQQLCLECDRVTPDQSRDERDDGILAPVLSKSVVQRPKCQIT